MIAWHPNVLRPLFGVRSVGPLPTGARCAARPPLVGLASALLACSLGLTGCYREFSDLTALEPFAWNAAVDVGGVRPGLSREELRAALGPPRAEVSVQGRALLRWTAGDLEVVLDPEGRAQEVVGTSLSAAGRALVWSGMDDTEVVRVLGRGRLEEHRRPSGSGVITLRREVVGRTRTYRQEDFRIDVESVPGGVVRIRLAREP